MLKCELEAQIKELEAKNARLQLQLDHTIKGTWDPYPQYFEIDMTIEATSYEIVLRRVYRVFKVRVDNWSQQWYNDDS